MNRYSTKQISYFPDVSLEERNRAKLLRLEMQRNKILEIDNNQESDGQLKFPYYEDVKIQNNR